MLFGSLNCSFLLWKEIAQSFVNLLMWCEIHPLRLRGWVQTAQHYFDPPLQSQYHCAVIRSPTAASKAVVIKFLKILHFLRTTNLLVRTFIRNKVETAPGHSPVSHYLPLSFATDYIDHWGDTVFWIWWWLHCPRH